MPRPRQDMPADFALYAAKEGNLRLRKRFHAAGVTIEAWRRQLGVSYTRQAMPKPTRPVMARKARRVALAPEVIEDLNDGFDLSRTVRSGGYGDW